MIAGITLGIMTFISMLLTFEKLPPVVKYFLRKYKLFTDVGAFVFVLITLSAVSKSLTAIIGATFTGLLVGVALEGDAYLESEPELKEALERKTTSITNRIKHKIHTHLLSWANNNVRQIP